MVEEIKSWNEHSGEVMDSVNGYDVIDCKECGFKHIIPLPTPEEIEAAYNHDYYTQEKPLYIERAREDLEWLNLAYDDRYDIFEKNLPKDRRRILDIGSGPGFFLLRGRQRGWETLGIEPSEQAYKHSSDLGLNIVNEFFDYELTTKLGKFDVVNMSEVLEHIVNPQEVLKLIYNLLEDNGLICISVPNDYNPFQYALRTVCDYNPWWVAPPHHINYFDFVSLKGLMTKIGFEVVLVEADFPIDMFLLMGDNYVGNEDFGKLCHEKRKNFEMNLNKAGLNSIRHRIYEALAESNLGRRILLVARK
ncbi:class I SAM-dependent methyltransferase [Phosphitispora sp. TUW77]|uniref:class I SAM-dependent methyltransferase n=1 Tax=Phosphitispora sp. TUW77 TaxID=3152361 RepID=UPI003AB72F4F